MAKTKKLYQKIIKRTLSWLMIICRQLLIVDTKKAVPLQTLLFLITPAVRLELTTT